VTAPVDDLVVGGGPVGMLVAAELCLANVSVTVLEAEDALAKTGPHAVRSLNWLTMRSLRLRGLEESVYEAAWRTEHERTAHDGGGFDVEEAGYRGFGSGSGARACFCWSIVCCPT
jgi:2-polyprenyl-6-methoxyphenol hydroxylase-like FAD-dependent oxidoreductase